MVEDLLVGLRHLASCCLVVPCCLEVGRLCLVVPCCLVEGLLYLEVPCCLVVDLDLEVRDQVGFSCLDLAAG